MQWWCVLIDRMLCFEREAWRLLVRSPSYILTAIIFCLTEVEQQRQVIALSLTLDHKSILKLPPSDLVWGASCHRIWQDSHPHRRFRGLCLPRQSKSQMISRRRTPNGLLTEAVENLMARWNAGTGLGGNEIRIRDSDPRGAARICDPGLSFNMGIRCDEPSLFPTQLELISMWLQTTSENAWFAIIKERRDGLLFVCTAHTPLSK